MNAHIFQRKNNWFAFNPLTLAVAELNANEVDFFSTFLQKHSLDEFRVLATKPSFWQEIPRDLSVRLHSLDFFFASVLAQAPHGGKDIEVVLNVTQACNLACEYCFSNNSNSIMMSEETAISAIEAAFKRHEGIQGFRLSFFGGEPTLNPKVIQKSAKHHFRRCHELGIEPSYFITTNAFDLNHEMAAFFGEYEFEVQVSIDGSSEAHNRYRVDHSGCGSYDKVRSNIATLSNTKGVKLSTSSVITKSNTAVAAHLKLDGLDPFHMKLDMVYEFQDMGGGDFESSGADFSKANGIDFDAIGDRFVEKVTRFQRPAEYNFRQSVILLWARKAKSRFCPAADTRIGVGADGKYFPCGASASLGENAIGSTQQGINRDAVGRFEEKLIVDETEPCRSCWAKPLCLGGCPLTIRSHPNRLHCATRKNLAEISIRIFSEIRQHDPMSFLVLADSPAGNALSTFFAV